MVNYRDILRLDHDGISRRQIAASVGSSRNKVSEILETASTKNVTWSLDETVTNAQFEEICFPNKHYLLSNYMLPDYERIHRKFAKPGVTLTLLWAEYARECETCGKRPYMMTQLGDK